MAAVTLVRVASPADLLQLPAVEAAADELVLRRGISDLPAPAPAEERATAWRVLVAGDPVRGFAVLERVDEDVHLEQVSVHPAVVRRGVGAALLEAAVEQARSVAAGRVTLLTYADVPWHGPWYARHGWRETADLGPGLQALREHERAIGLERYGRRIAMARAVR